MMRAAFLMLMVARVACAQIDSVRYWFSAGAGRGATSRGSALIGQLGVWGSKGPVVAGLRYTAIEPYPQPPSRDKSLMIGWHAPVRARRTSLVVAGGLGQASCAQCGADVFEPMPGSPGAHRVIDRRGVSSYGVSYHIELTSLIGRYGGFGFSVIGLHSSTVKYVAPTLTIQVGHTP